MDSDLIETLGWFQKTANLRKVMPSKRNGVCFSDFYLLAF